MPNRTIYSTFATWQMQTASSLPCNPRASPVAPLSLAAAILGPRLELRSLVTAFRYWEGPWITGSQSLSHDHNICSLQVTFVFPADRFMPRLWTPKIASVYQQAFEKLGATVLQARTSAKLAS